MTTGFLYFGKTTNGHVKIGFTTNAEQRRRDLVSSAPSDIPRPVRFAHWIVTIPVTIEQERSLHRLLSEGVNSERGEWYAPGSAGELLFSRMMESDTGRTALLLSLIEEASKRYGARPIRRLRTDAELGLHKTTFRFSPDELQLLNSIMAKKLWTARSTVMEAIKLLAARELKNGRKERKP